MRHDGRYEFAGTCIDGPDRGKHVVQPGPYYRTHWQPPVVIALYRVPVDIPPSFECHIYYYRWSYSLEQWCVEN